MREDPTKDDEFKQSDLWESQKYPDRIYVPNDDGNERTKTRFSFRSNSLSGHERNRLFIRHGDNFADLTLVSGADNTSDGRSFAIVDFNQDGWQDIALMSLNAPRFKLFRNEMSSLYPDNRALRFRLEGGNTGSLATNTLSNRDAIGATVMVNYESGKRVILQKQGGEGFASQNSEVLSIGIPSGDSVSKLEIQWPSGRTTELEQPDQSTIFTIKEVTE